MKKFYLQNSWDGGQADSSLRGIKGSFTEGVGVDIRSTPGLLKVSQALVKESAAIVTDFCKWGLVATDGNAYFFGDTGKVYKRTSAGVWTNPYTDANGAILGCGEWNGYIYWATSAKLGRQSVANAASEANWASANASWQNLTAATYHPMVVQGLYLLIGNDTKIATVDDIDTFTANGTPDVTLADLPTEYTITSMATFGIDILIGTRVTTSYSSALVGRWDLASPAYSALDDIPEVGVNCFIPTDNFMFIQAGNQGRIYYYDGSTISKTRKLAGDYANKTMTIYPGSYASFRGVACFGLSNLSGNPCLEGIYTISQYDSNYPLSIVLEYVPSPNHLTAMEIGAIVSIGNSLIVCWKDSTIPAGITYGADNISWTAKYGSAYIKTLSIGGERRKKKTYQEYDVAYKSKPTGTNISLSYYPNFNSSDTAITLDTETDYNKMFSKTHFEAGTVQFKLAFTASSNDAPEVEEFYTQWDEQEIL